MSELTSTSRHQQAARALACLDLTSLNLDDTTEPLPVGHAQAEHDGDRREEGALVMEHGGGDPPGERRGGRALHDEE